MKEIRRRYAVILTVITCVTCLVAGIITADANSKRLTFGEEFASVDLRNFNIDDFLDLF